MTKVRIDVSEEGGLVLSEVYSGILFENEEGHRLAVSMRDDTFELHIMPSPAQFVDGGPGSSWWRIDMKSGTMEEMRGTKSPSPAQSEGGSGSG